MRSSPTLVEALLDAGAHDAWVTPIVMKKGRPGHTVSALADTSLLDQVRTTLVAETGTLGVRMASLERWISSRREETVVLEGMPVRVKVSPGRLKVEQRDAARVSARSGLPLREVLMRAESAWRRAPRNDPHDRSGDSEIGGVFELAPERSDSPDPDPPTSA